MKSFHQNKYNFIGFDEREGLFRFESKHERVEQREVILVAEAKYILSNGRCITYHKGRPDNFERFKLAYQDKALL